MIVVFYNSIYVGNLLISSGVKWNVNNKVGKIVFYFVVFKGNVQFIQFLIDVGVYVDVVDNNGNIVLYCVL